MRVNALCPGLVDTAMIDTMDPDEEPLKTLIASHPLGHRLFTGDRGCGGLALFGQGGVHYRYISTHRRRLHGALAESNHLR